MPFAPVDAFCARCDKVHDFVHMSFSDTYVCFTHFRAPVVLRGIYAMPLRTDFECANGSYVHYPCLGSERCFDCGSVVPIPGRADYMTSFIGQIEVEVMLGETCGHLPATLPAIFWVLNAERREGMCKKLVMLPAALANIIVEMSCLPL